MATTKGSKKVIRKALWVGRDNDQGSSVEIFKNRPRNVTKAGSFGPYNILEGKNGERGLTDMCLEGFRDATGLTIEPGQILRLHVEITVPAKKRSK